MLGNSLRSPKTRKDTLCRLLPLLCALGIGGAGCEVDLGTRVDPPSMTFGSIVYKEACQRLTYSADLETSKKEPSSRLDVAGISRRAFCAGQAAPNPSDPKDVVALHKVRPDLVFGVDSAFPESLLPSFDSYLRALAPLQDEGTVSTLLGRSGALLTSLSKDPAFVEAMGRLGRVGGTRPRETAGGALRAVASAPALDDVTGVTLPLFDKGGPARAEFETLLLAAAYEIRHLSADQDPLSPERNARLLSDLLFSTHKDLSIGKPLLLAQRDHRGLPLLNGIVAPYVEDPSLKLPRADAQGRFIDAQGQPIPFVPPLPEVGMDDTKDKTKRDAQGRALRQDGMPLYQYFDLDGSLLLALLRDGSRLFPESKAGSPKVDIALGLLPAASKLAGSRLPQAEKTKDGETLRYKGFDDRDAKLLELAHGALQVLRFRSQGAAPGKEISDLISALRDVMEDPNNEGPLARGLHGLLQAADEAKKNEYDSAGIPTDSTLFDDLAPLLARIFAVPDRKGPMGQPVSLLEDLVLALKDPHGKNLGPMTAQLLSDRGAFYMRQPNSIDELNNGLRPEGVLGEYGNRTDPSAPDADAIIDWRGQRTNDPKNNRSVMQRLLHTLADTNGGRPFCNGRNASLFGGFVLFPKECEMFQLDNIARFFLLSIASRPLREDPTTFAKTSASFLEAIKNGRDCRCIVGDPDPKKRCEDPDAKRKCDALLTNIPDGDRGDGLLANMLGIRGFGRYPDPAPAGRSLFLDLGDADATPAFTPFQPKDLLFNHVLDGMGKLVVDRADPDNRKFIDGTGKERLFIDEHNGVLFALEKVRGPAVLADGTPNPFPNDNFYDALRPLVDAFAKHAECFETDMTGTCIRGQNAVQILADAMTILHRHWPSPRSSILGRSFVNSYGEKVKADNARSYEALATAIMNGDLLLGSTDLAEVLSRLQAGGRPALPLVGKLLRFVFDPSQVPAGGFASRSGKDKALRNDGQPAYVDDTLSQIVGKQEGRMTIFYLLKDALRASKAILDKEENRQAKARWDRGISDAIDAFLAVKVEQDMMGRKYRFDNPRIRPVSVLALAFVNRRISVHGADLGGWAKSLTSDLAEILRGPLFASLVDLGVQIDNNEEAVQKTNALLRQVLSTEKTIPALAASAGDGLQLLLNDADLLTLGKALSSALDPVTGLVDPGVRLLRRGHELEKSSAGITVRPLLPTILGNLTEPVAGRFGAYPLFLLGDAIGEVHRADPGSGGVFSAVDYGVLLGNVGAFLVDQNRGMERFIQIVKSRCSQGVAPSGECR